MPSLAGGMEAATDIRPKSVETPAGRSVNTVKSSPGVGWASTRKDASVPLNTWGPEGSVTSSLPQGMRTVMALWFTSAYHSARES